MPQSSIAEDESLVLDIEASLGTTEVFDLEDNYDACETSTKASNDISIDLNNFMQEMEEERDSAMGSMSLQLVGGGLGGDHGVDHSECCDEENCSEHQCCHHHPQHIGSNLQLEDLPSSRQGFDSWWSSSSNKGSFMGSFRGSFRKKMGSSFRLFHSSKSRKDKDASSKHHNQSSPSSENGDPNEHHHHHHESPQKRKKAVRFKKFDTIFPFYKSFSRVTVQTEEEEAYCASNHDHHDDDHHHDDDSPSHATTTNGNHHHSP